MSKHVEDLLTAYVHGELHGADLERVEHHLRDCRECRQELDNIRSVCSALGSVKSLQSRDALWSQVNGQLNRRRKRPIGRFALAAAAAIGAVAFWFGTQPLSQPTALVAAGPGFELFDVQGSVTVGSKAVTEGSRVRQGQAVCTGPDAKTKVAVADIGNIELSPNSELSLVASSAKEHRLRLTKGQISAKVVAPPRLLIIETAAGEAVDLGCAYTLKIDAQGDTVLKVTAGWVALEREGADGLVPSGWSCITRKKQGVGTPVCGSAPAAVRAALTRFDLHANGPALSDCLKVCRKEDALSLWHLLSRTLASDRELVWQALAKLSAPPADARKEDVLKLQPRALTAWRQSIMDSNGHSFLGLPFSLDIFR